MSRRVDRSHRQPNYRAPRDAGAALIVGLVLLMALTVLAISTMRSATMELTMAGNARYRESAFQLAEAGLNQVFASVAQAQRQGLPMPPTVLANCRTLLWGAPTMVVVGPAGRYLKGSYQTRVCYLGESTAVQSGQTFRELHYQIDSRGVTDERGAVAVHSLGFTLLVNAT